MSPATVSGVGHQPGVEHSILIAQDEVWSDPYFEYPGQRRYLFRTSAAQYFVLHQTAWQLERDWLEVIPRAEAVRLYTEMAVHEIGFEEAFPELEADTTWPLEGVSWTASLPPRGEAFP